MTDRFEDLPDVLGIRTPVAKLLTANFVVWGFVTTAHVSDATTRPWATIAAACLFAAAIAAMLLVRGDPLPLAWAVAITALGLAAAATTLWHIPVPQTVAAQTWLLGGNATIAVFGCIRGRPGFAWLLLGGQTVLGITWTVHTGQGVGAGIGITVMNFAPLAMATYFAYTIRPTAHMILRLRQAQHQRAATQAAATAAIAERDRRLRRLDESARPVLEAIASGRPIPPRLQQECRLLEARLRDEVRGRSLAGSTVLDAAQAARARDVHVVLLDDGGLDGADETVRSGVREVVRDVLATAQQGRVVARVLPPGRTGVATVLVEDCTGSRHLDIGTDGTVTSD